MKQRPRIYYAEIQKDLREGVDIAFFTRDSARIERIIGFSATR